MKTTKNGNSANPPRATFRYEYFAIPIVTLVLVYTYIKLDLRTY